MVGDVDSGGIHWRCDVPLIDGCEAILEAVRQRLGRRVPEPTTTSYAVAGPVHVMAIRTPRIDDEEGNASDSDSTKALAGDLPSQGFQRLL